MQEHTLTVGRAKLSVDAKGAWITILQDEDGDIIFPRVALIDSSGQPKLRGGCHVCIPQFGPALDSSGLPQHGFGRDSMWTLQDGGKSRLVFSLAPTHEDYIYLQAILTYTLKDKSLHMELSLHNDGMSDLRVAPAFHPYFATNRAATIGLDDLALPVDDYQQMKTVQGPSKLVEVNGRRLTLSSEELNTWALWSDQLGEYFCIEPTLGGNRFLNVQPEADELLTPNARVAYGFTISW